MAASEKDVIKEQARRIEQLEKELAKLKARPEREVKEKSEVSSGSLPISPQYQSQSKPDLRVAAEEVQKFLNYIATGAQLETESMLKKNPDLALTSGTVTDHAGRTFKDITGFQYAVWALDWHMWKMIRKYLTKDKAQEQAKGFIEGSWVKEHGEHVEWKKLTEAYQTLIENFSSWSWGQVNDHWVKQIGSAQFLLPIHVLQEYNQPDRPFHPCPKFETEYVLNRSQLGFNLFGLGRTVGAIFRSARYACNHTATLVPYSDGLPTKCDQAALVNLYDIRTQQREELVVELVKKPSISPLK